MLERFGQKNIISFEEWLNIKGFCKNKNKDKNMKYIDAERLKAEIENGTPNKVVLLVYRDIILSLIDSLQQEETSEISLEEFTEKMEDWKARYNHPDNIPIKATMAFTARMFYMYPNIAREWYDNLPKTTQD